MIKFKYNPLKYIYITSKFGVRVHPVTGVRGSFHNGIDLRASAGTPLYAVEDGTVVVSRANSGGVTKGFGYFTVIQHNGFCTLYAHLRSIHLKAGTKVKAGDLIGYSGATGAIAGAHLHFEVRTGQYDGNFFSKDSSGKNYSAIDPEIYILVEEKVIVKEKSWEQKLGEESIDTLSKLGMIENAEDWKSKDLTSATPLWLTFTLFARSNK